jgi:hypothetical protein
MEIKLTPQESEQYFYNSLCNGLSYMSGYGLDLECDDAAYKTAKQSLKDKSPDTTLCYEDIYMEVLRQGGSLVMNDVENDGDYTRSITLNEIHERVQKTMTRHLMDAINETDDAETADVILQTVFFEDIIFG